MYNLPVARRTVRSCFWLGTVCGFLQNTVPVCTWYWSPALIKKIGAFLLTFKARGPSDNYTRWGGSIHPTKHRYFKLSHANKLLLNYERKVVWVVILSIYSILFEIVLFTVCVHGRNKHTRIAVHGSMHCCQVSARVFRNFCEKNSSFLKQKLILSLLA